MTILIKDTTQAGAVSSASIPFKVSKGDIRALRSTNMDGTGVVTLYYDGRDGSIGNPSIFDDATPVTLTPSNPERLINVPGFYRVAVTSAATTPGIVYIE